MITHNFLLPIIGVLVILYVFRKIRRNQFSIELSLLWMSAGFAILILAVFPKMLDALSVFLGVHYPPSMLFLLSTFFLLYVIFRQEQMISHMQERLKELAQKMALLEKRIRQQEKNTGPETGS